MEVELLQVLKEDAAVSLNDRLREPGRAPLRSGASTPGTVTCSIAPSSSEGGITAPAGALSASDAIAAAVYMAVRHRPPTRAYLMPLSPLRSARAAGAARSSRRP